MTETILTNAILVLRDRLLAGTVVLRGANIVGVQAGRSAAPGAIDLDGDYLMPGVVDVHTDNLERQVLPRLNARWPSRSAMLAHDAQCAAAGVTTVLDALCLGDLGFDKDRMQTFRDGVVDLDALAGTGLLKSEHFLHLRCEMPAADVMEMVDPVADHPRVRMVSLMDHSPGVGQYANLDRYRAMRRKDGASEDYIERRIRELTEQRERLRTPNRRALLARVAGLDVTLASHDDRTVEEIEENLADGIRISEFPVSMEAAQAARVRGMQVIAGAPNIVRGGSHSGNVNAAELVRAGAVDAFASDYVPASLVEAAFICAETTAITLPEAVAMLTDNPAQMARLPDRGRIEAGLRGDLVRVRVHEGMPVVRQVWRTGERVA
ncbi:alpha-D-ribose 1-methylphosphonate 5-triphosphate diphosphatase [Limobrevibacterium gyesilva]|uniref:Alpha-D-ribose 1-methylphosphonate 5-triphosphate diphosphatase n=1 Tax=Limobrevibacterium gyesilva TaxID=2991712 RepID=A0AA41YUQ2_9PROT|nr:alpha-D-ribose 1-methylphosphonate 5-triphosphate diphosphatase [Limobrevibacterium gyesilva]MCW3475767.1 alpha-D-ribose 1-methylphosphonate 5-triphosphate diphosphatase [Limobrevibacterium gyesilva]